MQTDCHDCRCNVDDIKEYWYMLHRRVWVEATPDLAARLALLCVGCLEARLGRQLTGEDFNMEIQCNWMRRRSDRLKERIGMAKREFMMLAHPMKGDEPIGGWFASEKLDGCRAFWDGGITRGMLATSVPFANTAKDARYITPPKATGLWSRYGKVIQAPDWWLDKLPHLPLDGELHIGRGCFQLLISAVKKLVPGDEWGHVKYMAFDSPPMHAIFANGEIDNTNFKKVFSGIIHKLPPHEFDRPPDWGFHRVVEWLRERGPCNEVFQIHEQDRLPLHTTAARDHVSARLDALIAAGGEGLMLRHPTSLWAPIRTRTLLKVKGMEDAEGVVTGYTWGRETDKGSKLLGKMGALVLNFKGKRLELSGFTDDERTMCLEGSSHHQGMNLAFEEGCQHPGEVVKKDFHNPKFPLGGVVTFRYRELTDAGIPKEARYWRQRED